MTRMKKILISYKKGEVKKDVVNHPSHYTQGKIECIDAIAEATKHLLGIAAVCVANIIKYVWRYPFKNGLEDLYKAQWYLNELIKHEEEKAKNQKKD
jgi:hypothetical protein